jgi:hypothetical protein
MKAFFDALHRRLDLKDGTSVVELFFPTVPLNPGEQVPFIFRVPVILQMETLLNRALTMDDDPKVRARLKLVEREFVYLRNLVSLYTTYDTYRVCKTRTAFELLVAEKEKLDRLIDSWYDEQGRMKTEPGFAWPFFDSVSSHVLKYGGGEICPPIPGLKLDRLREEAMR